MAVRRELFDEAGGFDAEHLPNSLFDADFCLRLREKGLRNVFTPYAVLIRTGSESRTNKEKGAADSELEYFKNRWRSIIRNDPFYNPNLSKKNASFSIDI
jgi:GT2 family glycosyltransferase